MTAFAPPSAGQLDLKRALIAELEAAETAFLSMAPDEAIHAGRVRLKRTRALARIAARAAPWTARRIGGLARDIMHALSAARDLTALETLAERLAKAASGKRQHAKAGLALIAIAAELRQARAALPAADLHRAAEQTRSLIGLARALPALDDDDIATGLARVLRRCAKAWRKARGAKAETLRHTWRKREKDRLYALKLLTGHWPPQAPRRAKLSARLCDALGEERDALLLRAHLRAHPPEAMSKSGVKAAQRLIARRRHKDRLAADAYGRRLHDRQTAPLTAPES
jgi:hypothetical protein